MWIKELAEKNSDAANTTSEIIHQPQLWKKIWTKIYEERHEIQSFLGTISKDCNSIILTGAGTSAYIGIAAQRSFRKRLGIISEPISTTHIVSHPQDFILPSQSVLMLSFARSGNSPESCAAVELANKISKNASHFIITCNKDGRLAKENKSKENAYVFILPEEANDKSLAMTSSFTGMMLASILISRIDEIEALEKEVDKLVKYGTQCLEQAPYLWEIANKDFNRAVFLGSGPLYGVAKESQLKMQELTDGLVICKHDSFLGLRHGPKAVIDEKTFIVLHVSNNTHAHKYERDLIQTMKQNSNPVGQLAISENLCKSCAKHIDWAINFESNGTGDLDPDLLSVVSVMPTQLLALFKSIQLGLKPDNPSRNGAISRVVQGVSIYNT